MPELRTYTLEERIAYALCSWETCDRIPPSLEAYNEQIMEVQRTWRRLVSSGEAKDFIELLGKCGIVLSVEATSQQKESVE